MGASSKDLHVNKVLTKMAMGYRPLGMIADTLFPIVKVDKQSDIYLEADRGQILRAKRTERSPGVEANLAEDDFGSATYFARNYALKRSVTIEDKANTDPGMIFSKVEGKAQRCLDDIFLGWEVRVATKVTDTANVGSYSAVSSGWGGAGDPLGDTQAAIDNVQYANGVPKSGIKVTFGPQAWDSFRRDDTVRNLIFGVDNGGGYPNTAQVANLLDVKSVKVGEAFQNTADKGQDEALETIWGDNVLAHYTPERPSIEVPSFGYTFRWWQAALPAPLTVERHPYDSRKKAEEVEVGLYQDEKITGASYGFLLTAVNSST